MLDSLRNFATTWPGKILGAFLLVGLAGFGITGVLTSIGSNTVARVGDRDISIVDFQRLYQRQVNVVANQIGSVPTPEQALSLGIPSAVLNQLATEAALNILSTEFSLGVSDERLAQGLRADPAFGGTLGNFDREVFVATLRRNGITENDFFQSRKEAETRQQVAIALFGQIKTPEALNTLLNRFGEDRRALDYFVVGQDSLLPIVDPGDETLQTYLEENQNLYRTSEKRLVRTIQLSPEIIAKGLTITAAEIEAEYERTKANLISIEARSILQVSLDSQVIADQFQAGIDQGDTFVILAQSMGLEVTDLGLLTRAEISDPNLAETAFGLEQGGVAIIPSILGQRAIMVDEYEPAQQMTLAQARLRIEQKLALAQAREQFLDVLDQIEEQRAAFIDLGKTAAEFGLDLSEVAVTASGDELVEPMAFDPAEAGRVANSIFGAEIGQLASSVPLGANKNVWFELQSIEVAADQSLAVVRTDVLKAWVAEARATALEAKANTLVALINDGQSLSDVAIINSMFPQVSQSVSRSGDGGNIIDAGVAGAAYTGGVGTIGTAQNGAGDYVVFEVTSLTAASEGLSEADADFIASAYRDDMYADFTTSLREDAQMSINQGLLSQILGLGTDTGSYQ